MWPHYWGSTLLGTLSDASCVTRAFHSGQWKKNYPLTFRTSGDCSAYILVVHSLLLFSISSLVCLYFLTDLTEVFERFLFINSKCFNFLGLLLISYCFEEYCSHYFNFLNISYFIHRRIPFILEFFLDSFSTLDFFKLFCHPITNLQPIFNVPFVVKSPCTQFPRLFPMLFSYSNFHPQHHHIYLLRLT